MNDNLDINKLISEAESLYDLMKEAEYSLILSKVGLTVDDVIPDEVDRWLEIRQILRGLGRDSEIRNADSMISPYLRSESCE